jgi:hypothetical protein
VFRHFQERIAALNGAAQGAPGLLDLALHAGHLCVQHRRDGATLIGCAGDAFNAVLNIGQGSVKGTLLRSVFLRLNFA